VLIAELAFQRLLRAGDIRPVFDLLGFVVGAGSGPGGRSGRAPVAPRRALLGLRGGDAVRHRPWRLRRSGLRDSVLLVAGVADAFGGRPRRGQWSAWLGPWLETAVVVAPAAVVAAVVGRFGTRIRRASSGLRVVTFGAAIVAPAMLIYPSLLRVAEDHDRRLVEVQFAEQVRQQREEIQIGLRRSQEQIDRPARTRSRSARGRGGSLGQPEANGRSGLLPVVRTDLATQRLASAVEVYGPDGLLFKPALRSISRVHPGRPAVAGRKLRVEAVRGSVAAGARGAAVAARGPQPVRHEGGVSRVVGTLVVHVMPDFDALPFITSQSPYFELFRAPGSLRPLTPPSREVEFVVYGWSRMPIYSSADGSWPLDEALSRVSMPRASPSGRG